MIGAQVAVSWLFERMGAESSQNALIWREREVTYGELLERVDFWEAQLRTIGKVAGQVIAIEGTFSPNACALLLASLKLGTIAVPLTPLIRVHRDSYLSLAEARACVTLDENDQWAIEHRLGTGSHVLYQRLRERAHPGLVIFSSGSTGAPKAIVHDFQTLCEKFRKPRKKKCTLAFLLFDHIGGIDTLLNTLSSGGTIVTPSKREPHCVCEAIARYGVHTLPTSPTFLNLMLVSGAWKEFDLVSLRVIAYGSEPMPEATLKRLNELFPNVALVQTYGTSELGVLRSSSRNSSSLWFKFNDGSFETKVVDGVLWVRSPAAMLGYLNAPDLFDEEGWLNTQDSVEVEGEYIRVRGRITDLINVGGQKVYPAEVESVLMSMDNVCDATVYGEPNLLLGQVVAARVRLVAEEPFEDFKRRLRLFCRDRLARYQVPARIEVVQQQHVGTRFKKLRHE